MLTQLSIQSFATIDTIEIDFQTGFTALTGETGAGKSILLDALGLLLGDKADSGYVRYGCDQADVQGQFDITNHPDVAQWFDDMMIEITPSDPIHIRRVVKRDGRSKAFVNGQVTALGDLKRLGEQLVTIHGQHAQMALFKPAIQRQLLDALGNLTPLASQVGDAWRTWQQHHQHYQDWLNTIHQNKERTDYLQFLLQRFDEVQPQSQEFSQRMAQYQHQSQAAERMATATTASRQLNDEEGNGILPQCYQLERSLQQLSQFQPDIAQQLQSLSSAMAELEDIAAICQQWTQDDHLDPAEFQQLEQRIQQLSGLAKQINADPEQLHELHQQFNEELASIQPDDEQQQRMTTAVEAAQLQYGELSQKLTTAREQQAQALHPDLNQHLPELGLENAELSIDITPTDAGEHGQDLITFALAANKGQPPKAIQQVASGGELSRISLALQLELAKVTQTPTLIFDEADVGIGGGIAEKVGLLMATLGSSQQVLSITHQGQAAAKAHHQLKIAKQVRDDQTFSSVIPLSADERVEEIARMIGGQTLTKTTLNHAKELLGQADIFNISLIRNK